MSRTLPPISSTGADGICQDTVHHAATSAPLVNPGLARTLVAAVCDDLAERGFTAVEAYPTIGADPDATSAATPEFWLSVGFALAIDDDRFPVMRRDLA